MDKKWIGKWITDEDFHNLEPLDVFGREMDQTRTYYHREDLKNRHMLVRKTFEAECAPKSAFIDITADDYYKLYLNGQFIGQGPAPSYHFHYFYNRFDLSKHIKPGVNAIAVHVYYQGLINRVWNSGDYRHGMIAEVFLDGQPVFGTDAGWKYKNCCAYASGGTTGYDTQYLENIDMRLFIKGWRQPDFDDGGWPNAKVNGMSDHDLFLQQTPVLDVYEIAPESVKITAPGRYLIDFGHEITGQFTMRAHWRSGQTIIILHGEEMDDDGIRCEMRCNCNYREIWTLSGDGPEELEYYDYKAFRYVEVDCGDAEPQSFAAVVRHYPMDQSKCRFRSSNALLNQIWQICRNGVKYGTQEVYTDCPSREKGQYLGDMTVTACSHIYLSGGDLRLYKKALQDFARSAFITPGLMAVAPGSLMQEIADYSLQWPMQVLSYYQHSGDIEFLKEMYPCVTALENEFQKYEARNGLLHDLKDKWNLVDLPENYRDGYDFDLGRPPGSGCHNVVNAFYYGMRKSANAIREALGMDIVDIGTCRQSFLKAFYNTDTRLFVDAPGSAHSALHSNILPLLFGLALEESVSSIVALVRERGMRCGVYMAYFVLKALASAGEYDLLYSLLTSTGKHSWSNMIAQGATACFEAWGKDQKWNTSLCHPWASAPILVIIEDIIGLKPAAPGWKKIRFHPHIPQDLGRLALEFHTAAGKIKVLHSESKTQIQGPEGVEILQGG